MTASTAKATASGHQKPATAQRRHYSFFPYSIICSLLVFLLSSVLPPTVFHLYISLQNTSIYLRYNTFNLLVITHFAYSAIEPLLHTACSPAIPMSVRNISGIPALKAHKYTRQMIIAPMFCLPEPLKIPAHTPSKKDDRRNKMTV